MPTSIRRSVVSASFVLTCLLSASAHGAFEDQTTYCFGKIIDGDGSVLEGTEITVKDGLIEKIGNDLSDACVDLRHLTAVPGMIDAHTHITYALDGPSKGNAWSELGTVATENRLAATTENGIKTLMSGVTTIRDLNAIGRYDFELRDMINKGEVIGPRILTAGQAIHPSIDPPEPPVSATSAEFARSAAIERMEAGSDWIKIFATTGSADDLTSTAYYSSEAIKAAADVARSYGRRITIHSYGPEAVDAGIAAGVHSIDHPVGLSNAQIKAMQENGIIYVPTIDHNRYYRDHAHEYGYDETVQGNLTDFVARNIEPVKRAHNAGVKIAMGSDAVMSGFGDNLCELAAFGRAGLTPEETLQTATINGAELLGMADKIGSLKEGYIADIVGVSGDPLKDINNLIQGVKWVMTEGKIALEGDAVTHRPDCGTLP